MVMGSVAWDVSSGIAGRCIPKHSHRGQQLCQTPFCCPHFCNCFPCTWKYLVLWEIFFCRRVKDQERPPDSFLLGCCVDTQALADARPAGILFVCEAVFARECLMLGTQGWFLWFWGMFDICFLLYHLQSLLQSFEFASCRVHGGLQH